MKRAVIAGIDAYAAPYVTLTNVNDLISTQNLLVSKGFSVNSLINGAATKQNIVSAINSMINSSYAGDSMVFAFFGHGSYYYGGLEPDNKIECICPIDWYIGNIIRDYEFVSMFNNIRDGVNTDMFIGSCFAGGALVNELPQNVKVVNWSGCKEDQNCHGGYTTLNGVTEARGVFSTYLNYFIQSKSEIWSRQQIMTYVNYYVRSKFPDQEPFLRCTTTEKLQKVFQ